jgi:ech hydrogenase subunit F
MPNPFDLPMVGRTLRNLVSRPATRRYPVEVRAPFPGSRGTLEFDLDTCVLCGICARRCPAAAITCVREDKYFAIEQLTCLACGVCVEVCNKNSLRLSTDRRAVQTRADAGPDGQRPGHEEWHKQDAVAPVTAPAPNDATPTVGSPAQA